MGARTISTVSLFLLATAPAAWAQPPTAMAVAIQPGELTPAQIAALEDALTTAADELFAESVMGPGDVAEVGEEIPELAGCDSVSCWSRVGRELSASLVLIARVAVAGNKLLLSIRVVDTSAKRIIVRQQRPIRHDVLTYASDCRSVVQSLRDHLPASLRTALRGAAPLAPAPAPARPSPPAPVARERVELAGSAVDNPGWLGVKHVSVDFDTAERLGLSPPLGAQIKKMAPDGSAAVSGLRQGDVVIDYGGYAVKSRVDLVRLVRRTHSGTVVPVTVWRDGAAVVVSTRMVARGQPATAAAAPPPTEAAEPRTVTNDNLDISDSGFSYSHEEVTEVTEPVGSATFVTWSVAGIYLRMEEESFGSTFSSTAYGGGAGLGFRYLDPQGDFPGPDDPDGGRHCVTLSGAGVFTVMHMKSDFEDPSGMMTGMDYSSTVAYMELAVILGYTYLSFGALDPETLEQSGWGVTLGVQGGVTRMFNMEEDGPPTEFQTVFRPVLGLEFPSYNPGTGEVESFTIMGFIWPKPESFSVVLAAGGSF